MTTKTKIIFIEPVQAWQYDPFSDPLLGFLSVASEARERGRADISYLNIAGKRARSTDHRVSLDRIARESDIPFSPAYAFTATTLDYPEIERVAIYLKERDPSTYIMVGGPHFDSLPTKYWEKKIKNSPFDAIGKGEGEITIHPILEAMREDRRKIIVDRRDKKIDLANTIMPARDLLPREHYFERGNQTFGKAGIVIDGNSGTIMTSRGCPFTCDFCASPEIHGVRNVRYVPLQLVINEIEHLQNEYNIGALRWQDDCIPVNFIRQPGLDEYLATTGILSRGSARTSQVTMKDKGQSGHYVPRERILDQMWKAGFREIGFGIESAEDHVLNIMGKNANVEMHRTALLATKERGFLTRAFIMTGSPGEGPESADKMIELLSQTKPDVVTLTSFTPLPGTRMFKEPERYGIEILTKDWKKYDFALKRESGIEWTHRIKGLPVTVMERNREKLKDFIFNERMSNVSIFNRGNNA